MSSHSPGGGTFLSSISLTPIFSLYESLFTNLGKTEKETEEIKYNCLQYHVLKTRAQQVTRWAIFTNRTIGEVDYGFCFSSLPLASPCLQAHRVPAHPSLSHSEALSVQVPGPASVLSSSGWRGSWRVAAVGGGSEQHRGGQALPLEGAASDEQWGGGAGTECDSK